MKSPYYIPLVFLISLLSKYSYSEGTTINQDTVIGKSDTIDPGSGNGIDFFASDEPLRMTLYFDIRDFIKTKDQPQYFDAKMTVMLNDTDSVSQNIQLKARGFMRRSYCSFPPIMLKFKERGHEAEPIQKGGTIKLVTHCSKSSQFEGYLLKEYLSYRLYNLVTPYSFKTRLAEVTYVDINRPGSAFTAYGFLIENEDQMARRNNAVIIKTRNITQKQMNPADMERVAIFNYMIGNTDWSVPLQHNVKVIKPLDILSEKGIPVAYDFDYSGLVNTIYSAPAEELPIKSVKERYYLGLCTGDEEIRPIIDEFGGMKEKFIDTIDDFNYLSEGDKKYIDSYINSFYKLYRNSKILINDLNTTCKVF